MTETHGGAQRTLALSTETGGMPFFAPPMTAEQFERLSEFIRRQSGIRLSPGKKVMLEARLQKRLRCLGMNSFGAYCDRLLGSREGDEEIAEMINVVTTNKTDFFREPDHFRYLTEVIVPEFVAANEAKTGRSFCVWSAGCSSGEEPYTLSMVLSEYAQWHACFCFTILATDISTRVLGRARLGIYAEERVASVPEQLKQKYIMRSKDRKRGLVRIVPELRQRISFTQANLLAEDLILPKPVDVIFCRNVIIYFDRQCQEKLLERLSRSLKPGGYLLLGHSETVHGFPLPLLRIASTIYKKVT